jgi:hypothetical protein
MRAVFRGSPFLVFFRPVRLKNPFVYLEISIIFRTFVTVPESTINPIYSPSKTHSIMNKTWKTILQVVSYVITLLLGGAAGNVMM